jgi:hypothetical protein
MRVTFAHVLEQYWHRPSQQSQGVAMFVIANAPPFHNHEFLSVRNGRGR